VAKEPEELIIVKLGMWIHTSGFVEFQVDTIPSSDDLTKSIRVHLETNVANGSNILSSYEKAIEDNQKKSKKKKANSFNNKSPFDIHLTKPCYIIYTSAIYNWYFRKDDNGRIMVPKNGGDWPTRFYEHPRDIARDENNDSKIYEYGLRVKELPEDERHHFDIMMSVFQDGVDEEHETKIVIDPSIGHP